MGKMARPKKINTDDMIQIVNAYFKTEAAGNPDRLKCSLLEEFAERNGYSVKAYDFRRDINVRKHLEVLKQMVLDDNGMRIILGESYKNLDVNRILKVRRDPDELRKVMGEMDDYWKQVYEKSIETTKKAAEFRKEKEYLKVELKSVTQRLCDYQKDSSEAVANNKALLLENRYLRKMLKTYLYPALANEILQQDNLIKNADSKVTEQAKDKLIDGKFPVALREATEVDRKIQNHEEVLLEKMWKEIEGV
jgi:regulator of replication initiation timing